MSPGDTQGGKPLPTDVMIDNVSLGVRRDDGTSGARAAWRGRGVCPHEDKVMIMRVTSSWMTMTGVVLLLTTGCSGASGSLNDRAARSPTGGGDLVPPPPPNEGTNGGGPPPPPPPPEGTNGGGPGTNGLTPETYHCNVEQLNTLMRHPLSSVSNPGWLKSLKFPQQYSSYGLVHDTTTDTAVQNHRLLADVIGCALGADQYWYAGDGSIGPGVPSDPQGLNQTRLFEGQGMMKATENWTNTGLDGDQAIDVHTCLVTRLNAYGHFVPLWLRGNNVADKQVYTVAGAYSYDEALWLAVPSSDPDTAPGACRTGKTSSDPSAPVTSLPVQPRGVTLYAWPRKDLEDSCGPQTAAAVKWRVCGTLAEGSPKQINGCGINVKTVDWGMCEQAGGAGDPTKCPCVRSPSGSWSCTIDGGKRYYPVIETFLSPQDWHKIYDDHPAPKLGCRAPPSSPTGPKAAP